MDEVDAMATHFRFAQLSSQLWSWDTLIADSDLPYQNTAIHMERGLKTWPEDLAAVEPTAPL